MGLWSRLFGAERKERDHLSDLVDLYRDEAEHAACLRQHAAQARYPQVAVLLRRLAETEDGHAALLRDRINGLGGGVPPVAPVLEPSRNQWKRATTALEAAQRKRRRMIEQIAHWDPEEPETVALLRRIEGDDTQALSAYEDLVMRSDPHAID
jgi:rubrerythrin